MQLILFTPVNDFSGEINLLNHFLQDNLLTVHIRKPNFSEEQLSNYLNQIKVEFHPQLVIHNHIHLLNEFDLKGCHCTRHFLATFKKSISSLRLEYPDSTFSKSCHSLEELNNTEDYNYVFLSPIFNSISKENYQSIFSLKEVKEALKKTKTNVVALGGASSSNVSKLKEIDFYGVGVLGSVWNSLDPKNELINITFLLEDKEGVNK